MSVDSQHRSGRQPVMADVARVAGVSQKTVSRVVNDAPNVRGPVRARVLEAIDDLGFRPNAAARALVTQRTATIGIVTPGIPLYGPSAQLFGLERAAREAGYAVVIVSTAGGGRDELEAAVDRLLALQVDGLAIGAPVGGVGLPAAAFRGVPAIIVGDPLVDTAGCVWVSCDQATGARAATQHLLSLGHRTVWHVAGPPTWHSAEVRRESWAQALAEAGVEQEDPLVGDWTAASGYAAGLRLAERPDVTAVFAANDHMAVGVLRAFREHGRDVPAEVSVVGFDDTPESEYAMVPLTTVRQDFDALGRRAIAELVAGLSGRRSGAGPITLPVELVVRHSSGPAPVTALEPSTLRTRPLTGS
ncbi:MAG: Transcriptional regulator, LacI family [uncultured Nocardioidaceae bacterium]|uniref:Transcriptional regulator, LacI family n=1 Tax=uncultured Nocardioidaceae bacterium TaxID=253824 RepID=A0A6J4MCQ5_9ACTN|nr:MAG: Transcriptional regulator, LacI family [uncultured Nocardioidaceae bacterium]